MLVWARRAEKSAWVEVVRYRANPDDRGSCRRTGLPHEVTVRRLHRLKYGLVLDSDREL